MVEVSSQNNIYNVQATSGRQSVRVGATSKKNVNEVEASNDESKYWAGIAEDYANQAQNTVNGAIQSIQDETENGLEQIQDKYEELLSKSATTEEAGAIRLATEEEAVEGIDNSTAITPHTLNRVNSLNNTEINNRIDLFEQAEDTEMEEIVALIERRTANMTDLNEE